MRRRTGRGHGANKSSVLANCGLGARPTLYSPELALVAFQKVEGELGRSSRSSPQGRRASAPGRTAARHPHTKRTLESARRPRQAWTDLKPACPCSNRSRMASFRLRIASGPGSCPSGMPRGVRIVVSCPDHASTADDRRPRATLDGRRADAACGNTDVPQHPRALPSAARRRGARPSFSAVV